MDNNCNKVRMYYDFPILFDYLKDVKINRCRKTTIRSKSIIESKQNDKNNQYDNDTIDHHSKKLNSISFTRKIIDIQHDECFNNRSTNDNNNFITSNHSNLIVNQNFDKRMKKPKNLNNDSLLSTNRSTMYLVNDYLDQNNVVVDDGDYDYESKQQLSSNKQSIKSNVSRNKSMAKTIFSQENQYTDKYGMPHDNHRQSIQPEFNDGIIDDVDHHKMMMENFDHQKNLFDTYLFSKMLNIVDDDDDDDEYKMLPPKPAIIVENRMIGKDDLPNNNNQQNNSIIKDDQIKMNETSTTTVNNLSLIQSSNNNNMPLNDDNVDHGGKQDSIYHRNNDDDDQSIVLLSNNNNQTIDNRFESSLSFESIRIPNWDELCKRIYRFNYNYLMINDDNNHYNRHHYYDDYYPKFNNNNNNLDYHTIQPSSSSFVNHLYLPNQLIMDKSNNNDTDTMIHFQQQQQQNNNNNNKEFTKQINFTTNIVVNQTFTTATTTNKQNRSSEIELLSPLDIRKFINDQSRRIFLFYQDILLEKQSKMINLKQMIEQFHYDHYPITSQKLLLFDLCKEKIIEIFSMDLSTNQSTAMKNSDEPTTTLIIPLKMQKLKWPNDMEIFVEIVSDRIEKLLNINNDNDEQNDDDDDDEKSIRKLGLMTYCRKQRKLNFIDRILFNEMINDEYKFKWINFDWEINRIKNHLINMIWDDIIQQLIYKQCLQII